MNSITFQALIDGVHYDPKKGIVKIQLIANRISVDKLTTLGPHDESITVTLKSPQTEIEVFPLISNVREDGKTIVDEKGAARLKKAATVVEDAGEDEGIITEFPTGEKDDDD